MMKSSLLIVLFAIALFLATATIASELNLSARALKDEIIDLPDAPYYSRQFSGYIDVQNSTVHFFYWFVTAKNNPATAPVILTQSGGPGCSSLLALMTEWGPHAPCKNEQTGKAQLCLRTHTWSENYNMIFVESPDVGFTYLDRGAVPREWNNRIVSSRMTEFIENWYARFDAFKPNDFSILSESFGGFYIPSLARALIDELDTPRFNWLNFKFSIVGNPLVYLPYNDYSAYLTQINHKIIPYYPYGEQYIQHCTPDKTKQPPPSQLAPRPAICEQLERQMDGFAQAIDPYALSFPVCVNTKTMQLQSSSPYFKTWAKQKARAQRHSGHKYTDDDRMETRYALFDRLLAEKQREFEQKLEEMGLKGVFGPHDDYFPPEYEACQEDYLVEYMNRPDVQKAIGAKLTRPMWDFCVDCEWDNEEFGSSMVPVYKYNHQKNPKVKQLVFSGTNDQVCATHEAETAFFNNLNVKSQRVVMSDKGQQIGLETVFDELTFVTMLGGSHMIPTSKPYHYKYAIEQYFKQGPY